jgi:hypothetical protein
LVHGWVYWIKVSQLLHIYHHGSFPWIFNPSSQTSEEPFWYTSYVIGIFHHASSIHEGLCTKFLEFIQGLLPFEYMGLFLKTLRLLYICFFLNCSIEKKFLSNPWILQEI